LLQEEAGALRDKDFMQQVLERDSACGVKASITVYDESNGEAALVACLPFSHC